MPCYRHHNVFKEGLGECTNVKALLTLKPAATPVFRPKGPVTYAAIPIVEQELQWLQEIGVIEPVNFSNWAAPIVVVKKSNGSVRLYADHSIGLNEALESHQYPGMAEKCSHTATRIQPLPGKSYSLPSRGRNVVYENERTESECPAF
ncbi:unnamed protein product [Schistosoma mattheei]|uniref:Uncharacterized protein n=1 Tax=Schistosoma mattheei TaxID=31246 RepID=A0A183NRX2_9TREM|nr:unnamed protein product [Schistosoma mattheei]